MVDVAFGLCSGLPGLPELRDGEGMSHVTTDYINRTIAWTLIIVSTTNSVALTEWLSDWQASGGVGSLRADVTTMHPLS